MVDDGTPARRASLVGLGALTAFWLLVVLGATLQPGYAWTRDFVSALASQGARDPAVGVVALLSFGVAYLAAAVVLDRWVATRLGAALLAAAGLLTWVVALARIECPAGAAYCGLGRADVPSGDGGFGPDLHGWAVAASYSCVAVGMLVLAVLWWRRASRRPALASAVALVTSLATVPFWLGADSPGLAQRIWLGILTAWVVLVLVQPSLGGRGAEEARR